MIAKAKLRGPGLAGRLGVSVTGAEACMIHASVKSADNAGGIERIGQSGAAA